MARYKAQGIRKSGAGRKPIPTALHIAKGNPSKLDLTKRLSEEPEIINEPLESLSCMTPLAQTIFLKNVERLDKMKVLSESDSMALTVFSIESANYMEIQAEIKKERDKEPPDQARIEKLIKLSSKMGIGIVRLATEFGLTPSSRSKVKVNSEPDKPTDTLDSFINGD